MIECIKFKPYQKGCLIGFADFKIHSWAAIISGCSVYEKNNEKWVNLPSKEYTNEKGEKKFAPFIKFEDDDIYKDFSRGLKESVNNYIKNNNEYFVEKEFVATEEKSDLPF